MTSAKSYAKAYVAATASLDATERLAWLMVLQDRAAQRTLVRVLQQRTADEALAALGVPVPIARFLTVLAEDRMLGRLSSIAELGLTLALEEKIGVPVRLTTAERTDAMMTSISQALTQVADGPVLLDAQVDPRVLGGFRLELGSLRIDRSVAGRLAALKRTLVGA